MLSAFLFARYGAFIREDIMRSTIIALAATFLRAGAAYAQDQASPPPADAGAAAPADTTPAAPTDAVPASPMDQTAPAQAQPDNTAIAAPRGPLPIDPS